VQRFGAPSPLTPVAGNEGWPFPTSTSPACKIAKSLMFLDPITCDAHRPPAIECLQKRAASTELEAAYGDTFV
jgi:hypothetical protein